MNETKPSQLDLFSGIGGFSLAGHWAGFQTIAFCEREEYCQKVLAKHWPEVHCFDDITRLTGELIRGVHPGSIDVVTGGFPCQDISAAGRGAGISGNRSSLWFEFLRIIEECNPWWVVIENSPILRIRGADIVLEGLERAGYTAWPSVVGANDAGAPHKRQRVIIVAHRNGERVYAGTERSRRAKRADVDWRSAGTGLADTDSGSIPFEGRRSQRRNGIGPAGETVAQSDSSGQQEQCGAFAIRTEQLPVECGCSGMDYSRCARCQSRLLPERSATKDADITYPNSNSELGDDECSTMRSRLCASGPTAERSGRSSNTSGEIRELANSADGRVRCGLPQRETGQSACADEVWGIGRATQSGLGRDANGIPDRVDFIGWPVRPNETQHSWEPTRTGKKISNRAARLKALGNAVVPQVMYPFMQFIYEQLRMDAEEHQ